MVYNLGEFRGGRQHTYFFLNRALPLSITKNGNTTSSRWQEEGKRVERVQALPGNPPHLPDIETDAMGRKPGNTNIMSITATQKNDQNSRKPHIRSPELAKTMQKYQMARENGEDRLQLQNSAPPQPQLGLLVWIVCLAGSHSLISCSMPFLIISAPARSSPAASPFCNPVQYSRNEQREKTISKGVLICFFSKVARLRANHMAQQVAARPTV